MKQPLDTKDSAPSAKAAQAVGVRNNTMDQNLMEKNLPEYCPAFPPAITDMEESIASFIYPIKAWNGAPSMECNFYRGSAQRVRYFRVNFWWNFGDASTTSRCDADITNISPSPSEPPDPVAVHIKTAICSRCRCSYIKAQILERKTGSTESVR